MSGVRGIGKLNIFHRFRRPGEISMPVRSILILLFVILLIAAGYQLLFVHINNRQIDRETAELYGKSADHYIASVQEKLKGYFTSMGIIALNQTIRENIFRTDVSPSQMVTLGRELDGCIDEMTYFLYRDGDVFQHNLYTYLPADGRHFLKVEDARRQSWYGEIQKKSPCWRYVYSTTTRSNLLVIASVVNAFGSDGPKPEDNCYQTVTADTSVLFSPVASGFQDKNAAVFLFNDSDGKLIYGSDRGLETSVSDVYGKSKPFFTGKGRDPSGRVSLRAENGKTFSDLARPLDEIDATALFLYQPMAAVQAESAENRRESAVLEAGGGILVAFLAVLLLSYWIFTRRLNELILKMDRFDERSCAPLERMGGSDEISRIDRHLVRMQNRIHTLIQKKYAAEIEKVKAQNEALIACINPHFLYNTLNSISATACMEGADKADDMICSLSAIFQYSSDITENFVELRKEIRNIRNYLHLQSIRFGDTFRYAIDVDPALQDLPVPKQILQPIVENVFKHAFRNLGRTGELRISAETEGSYLILTVRDNGAGIGAEALKSLNRSFQKGPAAARKGGPPRIGLWNVHHRIRLIYGDGCGLTLSSAEGEYTRVTVRIFRSPPETARSAPGHCADITRREGGSC